LVIIVEIRGNGKILFDPKGLLFNRFWCMILHGKGLFTTLYGFTD
jgi:hypothetical protein